jgi:hypothetical protein
MVYFVFIIKIVHPPSGETPRYHSLHMKIHNLQCKLVAQRMLLFIVAQRTILFTVVQRMLLSFSTHCANVVALILFALRRGCCFHLLHTRSRVSNLKC